MSRVLVAMVAALAGYYVFLSRLPDCGPPRNTFLGQVYWLVPGALLVLQSVAVGSACRASHRRTVRTAAYVVGTGVVFLIVGFGIWLRFFAAGQCGE